MEVEMKLNCRSLSYVSGEYTKELPCRISYVGEASWAFQTATPATLLIMQMYAAPQQRSEPLLEKMEKWVPHKAAKFRSLP